MSKAINRRKFLTDTSLSAAGIIAGSSLVNSPAGRESSITSYELMKEVLKYRKIDAHCHPDPDLGRQIDTANRLGISKMQISQPSDDADFKPEYFIYHSY